MTSISAQEVRHIAHLARLKISDSEQEYYRDAITKILVSFEALSQLVIPEDQTGSPQPSSDAASKMRKDVAENSVSTKVFIEQAPSHEGVYLRVPAILDRE